MLKVSIVAACIAAFLILATPASAKPPVLIQPRCTTAPHPPLCAIHLHFKKTNILKARMGQRLYVYRHGAERHPEKIDYFLWKWWSAHTQVWKGYQRFVVRLRTDPVTMGRYYAARAGWTGVQWTSLYLLWGKYESSWNPRAMNPSSGACGIPQFLPCRYYGDAKRQILAGLVYVRARYGSPVRALAFRVANGWY